MVRALLASLAFFLVGAVGAAAQAAPPLEVYGRLAAIEEVDISPDGKSLAYIMLDGDQRRLVVQTLDRKLIATAPAGTTKLRGLQWAGPDHLLISTSATANNAVVASKSEVGQVSAFNVRTKKFALLMERSNEPSFNSVGSILATGTFEGRAVAYVTGYLRKADRGIAVYRVDLDTGYGRLVADGPSGSGGWIVRTDGTVVARSEYDSQAGVWKAAFKQGAGWKHALETREKIDPPNLVGLGKDGRTVLLARRQGDTWRIFETPGPEGPVTGPIDGEKPGDSVFFNPHTGHLMGRVSTGSDTRYSFFDPELDRRWKSVTGGFKGQRVRLTSFTPDFSKLVLYVEGPQDPGSYYLADTVAKRADLIGDTRPDLPSEAVGPVKAIKYKAADGLEIPAYLTLPAGREAKNLPLIVLPHGGPQAHDDGSFDWWSQALSSRGYAVLQPNFRGSDGYGEKFVEAGFGEWGRKMQTDVSDGVRHLAKEGLIDPKRVCIMGASYGGYAALAGAAIDTGVYRCAVAVAPVSDLPAMLSEEAESAGGRRNPTIRYWTRFMGSQNFRDPKLVEISPARRADRVTIPVMLIHGKDDTVVPYNQSTLMQRALQRAGKPVELVTLAAEDHWLSRGSTRLQMLSEAVRFVEKHNPPR